MSTLDDRCQPSSLQCRPAPFGAVSVMGTLAIFSFHYRTNPSAIFPNNGGITDYLLCVASEEGGVIVVALRSAGSSLLLRMVLGKGGNNLSSQCKLNQLGIGEPLQM